MFGKPSRRAKIQLRRFLIFILCAGGAAAVILLFVTGHFPALVFGNGSVRSISRVLPKNVQAGGSGFLYSEGSEIVCLNRYGSEAWSLDVGFADIATSASDDLILNYSGPNLQVMRDTKAQLFATAVDSDILGGAAGREYVAVLIAAPAADSSVTQMIYIFDQEGQKSSQLSFDREVIDFGFFSDDSQTDLFWVLSLDTSGAAPMSYVTVFNKTNGETVSQVSVSDRVIEKAYVTSNLIFVSGSGLLTGYTYLGEQQYELPVKGWKPAAAATEPLLFRAVYVPRADIPIESVRVAQAQESASSSNFSDCQFVLPMNIIDVAVSPTNVFAFAKDTMFVYALDGTLEKRQDLGADIRSLKQVSNEYVVLWGESNTYIMRLG